MTIKNFFRDRENIADILLFLTSHILLLSFFILLVTGIFFFLGGSANVFILPLSFLLSSIICSIYYKGFFKKGSVINIIIATLLLVLIYVTSYFLADNFYDISWDGQEYHQEIIIQLSENEWNPIKEDVPESVDEYMKPWVKHYPKSSEILASSVFEITNFIESGKIFNLLFIFTSFFLILGLILKYSSISLFIAILLSFSSAFSPVSVYQSLSYYVDGQVASMALILFGLIFLIIKSKNEKHLILWISAMVLLINLKFTGVAFTGLACICLLGFSLFQENKRFIKKIFLAEIIGVVIAIFLVGFSPYIENTYEKGHPFYPLGGREARDITSGITPIEIVELKGVRRFVVSYFTLTNDGERIYPRLPFIPNPNLGQFPRTYGDARVSGEGLFFMEIFIIAALLFFQILLVDRDKKRNFYLLISLFFLIVGVVVVPDNWWARYVPFLYLIPWTILVFSIWDKKKMCFLSQLLLFVMLLNSCTEIVKYIKPQIYSTQVINYVIEEANSSSDSVVVFSPSGFFYNNIERFVENGIDYEIVKDETKWLSIEGELYTFPNSDLFIKIFKE